jgi:acetyl-CoA acetyltransferase
LYRSFLTQGTDLGVVATVAAMKQIDLDPKLVEDVVFGNVSQTAIDTPYRKQACSFRSNKRQNVFFHFVD